MESNTLRRDWIILIGISLAVAAAGLPTASAEGLVEQPVTTLAGALRGSGGSYVAFSGDGAKILTYGGNTARVWSKESLKPVTEQIRHSAPIDDCDWIGTSDRFFTAGGHEVKLWDAFTGQALGGVVQDQPVKPTCVSPDGALLVTGNRPHAGVLWDARLGKLLRSFDGSGYLRSASFSRDGKKLFTVTWMEPLRYQARVIDPRTGANVIDPVRCDFTAEHSSAAEFSPDSNRIIVGEAGTWGSCSVFDLRTRKRLSRILYEGLGLHSGFSTEVHFTADGSAIIWALDVGVELRNPVTGEMIGKRAEHLLTGYHGDLAATRDGHFLFHAGLLDKPSVWDTRTGRRVQSFGKPGGVAIALSPDEKFLAVSYPNEALPSEGTTVVWRVEVQ